MNYSFSFNIGSLTFLFSNYSPHSILVIRYQNNEFIKNKTVSFLLTDSTDTFTISSKKRIMKKLLQLLIIIFLFLFMSCNKDRVFQKTCGTDNALEDIEWLKEIKARFEDNEGSDRIVQYMYNKRRVFLIEGCRFCPDALFYVYDCEQIEVCQFGGIGGVNTCPDFTEEATDEKILYED